MSAVELLRADPTVHRDDLVRLGVDYIGWVWTELERAFGVDVPAQIGMSAADYGAAVLDLVSGLAPPRGIFYLLQLDGQVAGMGGLRGLRPGVAELKRLYVCPQHRGSRLGACLLQQLIGDAGNFGFRHLCLDTAPFMTAAHRLYAAHGFVDAAAYDGTDVPAAWHARWRFMERAL